MGTVANAVPCFWIVASGTIPGYTTTRRIRPTIASPPVAVAPRKPMPVGMANASLTPVAVAARTPFV